MIVDGHTAHEDKEDCQCTLWTIGKKGSVTAKEKLTCIQLNRK